MKKNLHLVIAAAAFFLSQKSNAQCSFTPTIVPNQIIFCPYETDTLSTQVYDSYQWLKNNRPIPGATQRQLVIQQEKDLGYSFKVVVTKNGCKDTSARVITDGYVFSPPILIETGDIGVYNPYIGALIQCPDDTLVLTFGQTYTENIQWYNLQQPINGATGQSYNVTKSGSYTVCGAPALCPNFIQCENLPLNAIFENPVATITQQGDSLVASPAKKYQWFLYNKKIEGANSRYYLPAKNGAYTVITIDKYTCNAQSNPYFYTSHHNLISVAPNPVKDVLHLNINAAAKQVMIVDLYGNEKLRTTVTAREQNIYVQSLKTGTYILRVLDAAGKQVASTTIIKE